MISQDEARARNLAALTRSQSKARTINTHPCDTCGAPINTRYGDYLIQELDRLRAGGIEAEIVDDGENYIHLVRTKWEGYYPPRDRSRG
jgi:hypothetical protein